MQGGPQIILYSPSLYPCLTGGYELYNYHLFNHLLQRDSGYDYQVFTSCDAYLKDRPGAHLLRLRLFGLRRWGLGALSALIWVGLHRKIRVRKVKSIYTSYVGSLASDTIVFLLMMRFFLRIPYVIHIHGGGMLPWSPPFLHKALFRHAGRIAGVSAPICEEYEKRSGRKIDLILPVMPFLPPSDLKEALKPEMGFGNFDRIILYVGSMKPLKAPGVLLRAFIDLGEEAMEQHNPALLFCGDGELREELMEISRKSFCSERIRFMGNVANEIISDFYEIADVFVIPSWFEGTPIALMQAMKAGLTVIGTNVSGINNLIVKGETGLLFEKDDSEGLTNLLKDVFSDRCNTDDMAANAKEKIHAIHDYNAHLDQLSEYLKM